MATRSKPARRSTASVTHASPEPDLKAARKLVMELLDIPGTSGHEGQIRAAIVKQLRAAGAPAAAIRGDEAQKKTPIGGECGNLALVLPGTLNGPRRLLMAHMDTVPLCVGTKPVMKGTHVRSGNKLTGLGADNRAGCAVVLIAALEILRRKLSHPPLTFFWPIQEEVGLFGARHADLKILDKPKLCFNWDGGDPTKITVGATGAFRIMLTIHGLASHAGGAPERGVSAITIAGVAIASLQSGGWLGDVRKGDRRGTSNVGVIQGGAATNVVTDLVTVRAECRSHDPEFRQEILQAITTAFERSAAQIKNTAGVCGSVKIETRLDYESFRLKDDEPTIVAAESAVRACGGEPMRGISNGGLDANWLTARGLPTVTLGCGQENAHTVAEALNLAQFDDACRIGLRIATG
ncbi:MAG: M20/M25/M40 family metallo-hydrolase [Planctomycetaceae bacterium]|nr:M20/M25/M40 family metallo-hydrolase [Planctomycetaceae bacterium]